MTTAFPTGLDTLTNPNSAGGDTLATVAHDSQHANANDALEALEAKVGIDGSSAATAHDYLLNHLAPTATMALPSDLSPPQITADQNDYNPTNLQTSTVLRLDANAARNITGLTAPTTQADGNVKCIINVGSFNIVLKDSSTSSAGANRFKLGADITLTPSQGLILWYDTSSSKWRPLGAVTTAGGGGAIATDTIWAAKGDQAVATANDAASVVSVGANNRLWVADSTAGNGIAWKLLDDTIHGTLGTDLHHPKAHGPADHTDQTRPIVVDAEAFNVVGPAAMSNSGSDPNEIRFAALDSATTERVRFKLRVPDDWVSGMSITLAWLAVGPGGGAETVRWSVDYRYFTDNSSGVASGTNVTWTGVSRTRSANDVQEEIAQAIATGAGAGKWLGVTIKRIGGDAADTLTGDAGLLAARFDFTAMQ